MSSVASAVPEPANRPLQRFRSGPAIVAAIAAATLALHLLTAGRYGIFRDELYYLACSQHLAAGYVDQPPLIAIIAWFVRHVLGDSLLAIRLLPALAGAATVWLSGRLAREMGGGRVAQALAALGILFAPIYLVLDHWLTMNAFEPVLWMGAAWCVLRAINTGNQHYWFWLGVIVGLGLENKYSMAFFTLGVLVGVLATPERRVLKSRWVWLGALAALAIFLPNFIWLVRHNFPFLELMHNIRQSHRDIVRGPVAFIADQAMIMGPLLFPLWAAGVAWLFFSRNGRRYRVLGWTYLAVLVIFIVLKGKNYYLAPAYPMLFAAGGIAFERVTQARWRWLRPAYFVLILILGIASLPLSVPILSPEAFLHYQKASGLEPVKAENQNNGPLPQYFADEFGWEEMVRRVAAVYNSLPPEERARTAIFASGGYGEAAAIDFFGPKYGLPKALSGHQSYWYWGPQNYDGSSVIVLGSDGTGDREHFASVEVRGEVQNPYSRRDEWFPILLCRGLKVNLQTAWPELKHWN
jgi:dolichyl-phosphate-mannose-protein mannosyltransferase